jgi:hypothetical protein
MINRKACERKWSWSKLRWETSVRIVGLRTKIRTRNLQNTKHDCLPLDHVVRWGHKSSTLQLNLYLLHLMCSWRVFRTARRTPWRRVELWALRTGWHFPTLKRHRTNNTTYRYGHVTDSEGWECFTRAAARVSQTQNTCVPLSGPRPYWRTCCPSYITISQQTRTSSLIKPQLQQTNLFNVLYVTVRTAADSILKQVLLIYFPRRNPWNPFPRYFGKHSYRLFKKSVLMR